jgi:alpha-beta hydrolase superfamily lysophospholipase
MTAAAGYTTETHTAGDGYVWRYRRYEADGTERGRVVSLHGIQSHGGWYEYSCRRLAGAGYTVSFLDRRGSGLNEERRGDAPSFRRLLDDIAEFLRAERQARPGVPVFLVAISWGGKLATALQRRHPGLADGLALLCPGLRARVKPSSRQRLAILWARLVAPSKLFRVPLDDPALFTATPRWQQFIRDDPLSLRRATARLLLESARLDGYLHWVPAHVRLPVLLLLAGQDRIIDNARTRAFVERFASADRQVIDYPEAHHTLEFEPDPDRHVNDLLAWLDRLTSPPSGASRPSAPPPP